MFRNSAIFRFLGWTALAVYFLITASFLGVRYWLLPEIDRWRPYIAEQLSTALEMEVSVGKVQAGMTGLDLDLELSSVDLIDPRGRRTLRLPELRAVLSWRSLFQGVPQFVRLEAYGLDLSVRRDKQRRLWLLGQAIELDTAEPVLPDSDHSALAWLTKQRQIVLRNTTIRWRDEYRGAPELVLRDVQLKLKNDASDHSFSLSATPPPVLGRTFDLRGEFSSSAGATPGQPLRNWDGQLYMHVEDMLPVGWQPWVDIPPGFESGRLSVQTWLEIRQGRPGHATADVTVKDGRWALASDAGLQIKAGRLYASGSLPAFLRLQQTSMALYEPPAARVVPVSGLEPAPGTKADDAGDSEVQFQFQGDEIEFQAYSVFKFPMAFDHIGLMGKLGLSSNGSLHAAFDHAHLLNRDMDAWVSGTWRQGGSGPAGVADFQGIFKRAAIGAIDEYLPNIVDLEARQWMARGLVGGELHDARVTLRGDLTHFPFGDDPHLGDFRVSGRYTDGIIDYLPTEGGERGWPRLDDMTGRAELHRVDLRVVAEKATMHPSDSTAIALRDVRAQIPSIERHSVLTIQGDTTAPSEAYLALMNDSPLGDILDHAFRTASAKGVWDVPLRLVIPLLQPRDATVRGAIRFNDGSIVLRPGNPTLDNVNGVLDFSDTEIKARDIHARLLGGPVTLSGGVGGTQKGLQLRGQASASALREYVGVKGMKRLEGATSYHVVARRDTPGNYSFTLDSELVGMSLDLPEPLGKPAGRSMPLHVTWSSRKGLPGMGLSATLAGMHVDLLHKNGTKDAPYFFAGAIGVNQRPKVPAQGLNVDIQYPNVDVDSWNLIIDEFSAAAADALRKRQLSLLPGLSQLRLQSDLVQFLGIELDHVTFTARRPDPVGWRVDISSSQSAGTVHWRESRGKVAGGVEAKFDRLALGSQGNSASSETADAETDDDVSDLENYLDIPVIDLQVDKFKFYGHELGRLVVRGTNQSRGKLWKLDKLGLTSPFAQIKGSGTWRLDGPDRGLSLDAQADISNLGGYLDQLDYKNIMIGGSGTVSGQFEWRNLPRAFRKTDLNGRMEVSLENGRFSNVESRSARLLALLSLQSIRRLAAFKLDLNNLAKEGFPYDKLRGTLMVNRGVMSTANYRVIGPIGTIVIGGDTNLVTQKLDLQAVVIPNLDVSGAAIAAGIAINPIVGIGAFLTQWLLQAPLAKAMTVQYQIGGDWDNPQVKEVVQVGDAKAPAGNANGSPPPNPAPRPRVIEH